MALFLSLSLSLSLSLVWEKNSSSLDSRRARVPESGVAPRDNGNIFQEKP